MSGVDTTPDDIKYMLELAEQQVAHHRAEVIKWEQTVQRLKKTQINYTTQKTAHDNQVQQLETELSKARTTGPAAALNNTNGQFGTQSKNINTQFQSNNNNPTRFSSRPSLIAIQANATTQQQSQQQQQQQQQSSQPKSDKPKLICKVLYGYAGIPDNNVMALTAGEHLLIHSTDGDWYLVQRTNDRKEGYGPQQFAPRNYLQIIDTDEDDLPPSAPKQTNVTVRPAYASNTLKPSQFPSSSTSSSTTINSTPSVIQSQPLAIDRTPSIVQAQNQISPTNVTPNVAQQPVKRAGPPPFRGSVGPSSQPMTTPTINPTPSTQQSTTSPTNGSGVVAKRPPPFPGAGGGVNTTTSPPPPPKPKEQKCVALFDFQSNDPGLLNFQRGDIFTMIGENGSSPWWLVHNSNGQEGYVPSNYVKMQ